MRKSRFTDEQIIAILQESAAGGTTGELIRRHGISRETFYKWRRKYGGLHGLLPEAESVSVLDEARARLSRSGPLTDVASPVPHEILLRPAS